MTTTTEKWILPTGPATIAAAMTVALQGAGESLTEAAGAVLRRYAERRATRKAIRHLRDLDDHMLKDIGLHRSQIASAVVHGRPERL